MPDAPKISLRLHSGMKPAACLVQARIAEACRFHGIWLAENPFSRGIMPTAAAVVATTSRLLVGPGVFNPFNRHPSLMAMDMVALDELSGGRARLAVGAGSAGPVHRMGHSYERPLTAVKDAVTILRGLLAGEEVHHDGQLFKARGIRLECPVARQIPLYLAARGERSLALAARLGDGLILPNMSSAAYAGFAARLVRALRRAEGVSRPFDIVHYVPCVVHADRSEAHRRAMQSIAAMLPVFFMLGHQQPAALAALTGDSGIEPTEIAAAVEQLRSGKGAEQVLDGRHVEQFAVAGTAEDCTAQLFERATRGVSEIALTFEGEDVEWQMAALTTGLPRDQRTGPG